MISDQAVGPAARVVSGAPRDTLHMLNVTFSQDHGQRPDVLVADSESYSDLCSGSQASWILHSCRVSTSKTFGGLSQRQRAELAAHLDRQR